MYKLLATDVDDTLLNSERTASEANIRAIRAARAMGVKVILCSGRPCAGMVGFLEEWGIVDPVIGSGGAEVYDPLTKKMLFHDPLSVDESKLILDWAKEKGVHAQVYKDDHFIFSRHSDCVELYKTVTHLKPKFDPRFRENMSYPTNKVLLISNRERIPELREEAQTWFGDRYFITTSKPEFLEFMKATATKGAALRRLTEYFGFTREEVIAVGDERIDVTMLEYAGLGVAVGNAVEECKAAADYIAPDCDHDAVAHVIEQFILRK